MNRRILSLLIAALPIPAMAQTGPTYLSPTAISAPGSYPSSKISVGSPVNTAVVELQATGSGTGLSFFIQGTPIGSTTAVALKMYTAPACAATASTGIANGDWFVPVAGFTNIQLVVSTVTGSETFGITPSAASNCSSVAGAPVTTTSTGPTAAAYTDTVVSLTAATDTTLLAAGTYKSVCMMDIGTNPVTLTNGSSAAVVGNGQALSGAGGTGQQGGSYCWPLPPTTAIHGKSTLGTTVIVTVGQ